MAAVHQKRFAERRFMTIPCNAFYVTALPRKNLIAILVMFYCYFILAISLSVFIRISQFLKILTGQLFLTSFILANVGNQLKVEPNAMETDDASM